MNLPFASFGLKSLASMTSTFKRMFGAWNILKLASRPTSESYTYIITRTETDIRSLIQLFCFNLL